MKQVCLGIVITLALSGIVSAEAIKEDNQHIRSWNAFAQNILKLHQQMIKAKDIRVEKRRGGYPYMKDWYFLEERFIEKDSERLISQIQWDSSKGNQLHSIETYVYDKQGRVIRDYMAAYLPTYHNAPTQTLISLHRYSHGLHAFRTFDASGDRIVERCQGTHQGKPLEMLLDEDEIAGMQYEKNSIMQSAEYKACFGDLQTEVEDYRLPQ